jgi:branched-chain amino acid transport system permease protein
MLLQLSVAGLTTGAVYAIIALGFITIYRASNILNLAQGEFVMLGGLATAFGLQRLGLPLPLAAAAATALVTAIGMLVHRLVIQPLKRESVLLLIMVTIGVSTFLSGAAGLVFGTAPQTLPAFIQHPPLRLLASVRVPVQSLFVLGATGILMTALYILGRRTIMGKAMEAVSTARLGADLSGIPGDLLVMLAFGISAATGALAGIFVTPLFFTQYNAGALLGLKGFAAAVIGGWGRYSGAVLGGLVLGLIEALSIAVIPAGFKDAVAFAVLLLILQIRPKGILGSRALEEARK